MSAREVHEAPFLRSVLLDRDRIEHPDEYPFVLPAVQALEHLELPAVTYFIGENGSGKSTILEAIALACGFNAEGGTINFNFATRRSESPLHQCIHLDRAPRRPRTGFFLRAESFFNEAALSPSRQLSLLLRMHELLEEGSQFIIATHAPIVLAYPGATIYQLDERGITSVDYDQTEHVELTRDFLNDRDRYLQRLLAPQSS